MKKTKGGDRVRVSVFGLGYVGVVAAACLADRGHRVIAVEKNPLKVATVNSGAAPIAELGLQEIIGRVVATGALRATDEPAEAVRATELSIICVGTPSQPSGDVRLDDLENVCREIGQVLATKNDFHLVIVSSTVPPGTTRHLVIPTIAEASGKVHGESFGVCFSPEFLREGNAVDDYFHPPRVVIGSSDERFGHLAEELWAGFEAPIVQASLETAEMVKLTDNAWHALKVTFANEIGRLSKAFGVDSHAVMDIFVADTTLNISSRYLRPGFAFGGSCLPKDLRTLTFRADSLAVDIPLLDAILPSNEAHIERATQMILSCGKRRVGLFGLSFKPGTDDLRESPLLALAKRLTDEGCDLRIFEPNVVPERLIGANLDFVQMVLPNICDFLVDSVEILLDHAEVVVMGNDDAVFRRVLSALRPEQFVVELVRMTESPIDPERHQGIGW